MKFFIRLAIFVAIVIGILLWLQDRTERQQAEGRRRAGTETRAKAERPQPTPPPPAPMSATPAPQTTPPPMPQPGPCSRVRAVAARLGITVVRCSQQDEFTVATLQARDRNLLGDFLDAAMREGMRDFDVNRQAYRTMMDGQGRPVHENTFWMRW
jgi:type IV secretory pathway VirB10-like protein